MSTRNLVMFTTFLVLHTMSQAASVAEQYTLSEQCGKRAEEDWAARRQGTPGLYGPNSWVRYENHYSNKLNICSVMHIRTEKTGADEWTHLTLFNVNDHKEIGSRISKNRKTRLCTFQGGQCTSEAEWEKLIAPYWKQ